MNLVAVTNINADIGGTLVRAKKGDELDLPAEVARVLLDAEQVAVPDGAIQEATPMPPLLFTSLADPPAVPTPEVSPVTKLKDRISEARKALVAAAALGVTLLVADVSDALSDEVTGIIAVASALILTWLVPNKAPEA